MIIIDEVLNAINTAMELAQKKNDKDAAEKLVTIYSSILELKKENEELRSKLAEYEKTDNEADDLIPTDQGLYYRKSELDAGRKVLYCAACYNNTRKLYPIAQSPIQHVICCPNCKALYKAVKQ